MIEKLSFVLENMCGISREDRILVGVSGGIDSIALLYALNESGYRIAVGHLDHGLRDGSAKEAAFVQKVAEEKDLAFFSSSVETRAFASEKKLSLEEAARKLRYEFLFKTAAENGFKAVAVGHHADDQAETVLLHLLRGSGLKGLAGMDYQRLTQWHPEIVLIRPLLEVPREELAEYCEKNNLATLEDESNLDVGFLRNRIRHEVLPALEEINPQVSAGLGRLADIVRGDLFLLEEITDKYWAGLERGVAPDVVSFSRKGFLTAPYALQRRIMRKAVRFLVPNLDDIGYDLIKHAIEAVNHPPVSRQVDLARGLRLEVEPKIVRINYWEAEKDLSEFPQLKKDQQFVMKAPGIYDLGAGWQIRLSAVDLPDRSEIKNNQDLFIAYMDLGDSPLNILVRCRAAGDRITPLGLDGHSIKVSDLMINERLMKEARKFWPIIEINGEIAWVPGLRTAHQVRVMPNSENIYKIEIFRKKEF